MYVRRSTAAQCAATKATTKYPIQSPTRLFREETTTNRPSFEVMKKQQRLHANGFTRRTALGLTADPSRKSASPFGEELSPHPAGKRILPSRLFRAVRRRSSVFQAVSCIFQRRLDLTPKPLERSERRAAVVPSNQMRRCIVQFAVVLAMFSVGANAWCSAKCVASSCSLAPEPVPAEHDNGCHHHDNPTAPAGGDQACTHPQLFANDSLRTVIPVPSDGMLQLVLPQLGTVGINLISPASVILLESSPPSFPDIVLTTLLRV
jgi:hypothetical protein